MSVLYCTHCDTLVDTDWDVEHFNEQGECHAEQTTFRVDGAPDYIWLVYGELEEDIRHNDIDEVLWCSDPQHDSDVKYVRNDIASAERALLTEALKEIAETVVHAPEGGHEEVAECVRIARAALEKVSK